MESDEMLRETMAKLGPTYKYEAVQKARAGRFVEGCKRERVEV